MAPFQTRELSAIGLTEDEYDRALLGQRKTKLRVEVVCVPGDINACPLLRDCPFWTEESCTFKVREVFQPVLE